MRNNTKNTKTLNTQNRQQNIKKKKTNIKLINKKIEHLIRTERKYQWGNETSTRHTVHQPTYRLHYNTHTQPMRQQQDILYTNPHLDYTTIHTLNQRFLVASFC